MLLQPNPEKETWLTITSLQSLDLRKLNIIIGVPEIETMYKDTVYDYYEGFTKGLTVHCIFKQALKHKWMIYSDIKWIVEELNDQDLTTKNHKKWHHLYKNMQILKNIKKGNKKVVFQYPNIPLLVRILKKKTI